MGQKIRNIRDIGIRYFLKAVFLLAICVAMMTLSSCVSFPLKPQMTPLEIQAMQTRQYEEGKDIVFASVISVFQDLGYTIKSADKETGLITTQGLATSDTGYNLWGITSVNRQVQAVAFVEVIRDKTNVRLNFVATKSSSGVYGQTERNDSAILDANVYQNAFEKIENAIFVRSAQN